ncbi:MAG: VOC family protein [Oscillospiraceae bacterium]|nr:VOC family protein [Oscillospiraceae bacterium]
MIKVIEPILIFTGQAGQAIELYKKAFGAQVKVHMLYSDADPKDLQYKDEHKNFVYHAQLKIGNQIIMIADDCDVGASGGNQSKSFSIDLVVQFDCDDELKAACELLSEGGTVTEPLCSPTFCSLSVALIDKFGGRWQLMSGYEG